MHGPDGTDYPNFIEYVEIETSSRIVYTNRGDVYDGKELRFTSTVSFEEQGDATDVILRMVFEDPETRDFVKEKFGAVEGGQQTLISLAKHLSESRSSLP